MIVQSRQTLLKNYKAEHEKCEICGHYATTVHHILPVSLGGTDEEYNLQALCIECHAKAHKYGINNNYLIKSGIKKRRGKAEIDYFGLLEYIAKETEGYTATGSEIVGMINEYYRLTHPEEKEE